MTITEQRINIKIVNEILDIVFFFILCLQNSVCILHLQHISIWNSYISSSQQLYTWLVPTVLLGLDLDP